VLRLTVTAFLSFQANSSVATVFSIGQSSRYILVVIFIRCHNPHRSRPPLASRPSSYSTAIPFEIGSTPRFLVFYGQCSFDEETLITGLIRLWFPNLLLSKSRHICFGSPRRMVGEA
jgi:hypothetical protein